MSDASRDMLSAVFADRWEGEKLANAEYLSERFVFHMIEAAPDVKCLSALLENIANAESAAVAGKELYDFFLDALPHLIAAAQLYDYIPEIFPEQRGVHRETNEE